MNIYVPAFSLCNFSDKAVEMQTVKNVRQKVIKSLFMVQFNFFYKVLQKA